LVDEEGLNFKDAKARALRSFGNVTLARWRRQRRDDRHLQRR
jgi:hypothetical protein